jgi:hypothetical protein
MSDVTVATPSESTAAGRLLVCERGGQWAGALRRELARSGVEVGETRSLAECWDALAASPASFLVVELTRAGAEDLLGRMVRRERDFPLAQVAVVAARSLAGWQWLVREAGAVHFTCAPRQLGVLADLACRHLASVPAPPQRLTDRIWAGLPWGKELSA